MSLTNDNLLQIRALFEECTRPIQGGLEALHNDISEIYDMLADLQKAQ